jgi:hypothetical protein
VGAVKHAVGKILENPEIRNHLIDVGREPETNDIAGRPTIINGEVRTTGERRDDRL